MTVYANRVSILSNSTSKINIINFIQMPPLCFTVKKLSLFINDWVHHTKITLFLSDTSLRLTNESVTKKIDFEVSYSMSVKVLVKGLVIGIRWVGDGVRISM